jgi:hypothetical protein
MVFMRNWLIGGMAFAGAIGAVVPANALLGLCGGIGTCEAAEDAPRRQFEHISYDGRFIFARISYEIAGMGWGGRYRIGNGGVPWSHDYPDAEHNFTQILRELTYVRPYTDGGNILTVDDPRLTKFPVAYMSEPGYWQVNDNEAKALRNYLLKGGFIIFDDFGNGRDDRQMYNLMEQMSRVLPELRFLPLDGTEPVFDSFFKIDPGTINLIYNGRPPEFYGLFENNDKSKRMLAVAGNYGDLGEFWEYSATGWAPVDMSNEAYKVGVNYIIYAMTH